ncbi:MAG: hypothetical protein D6753_06565 [Planctomycetota bacterium]|nr:MAG: hypothetical protein D6753_06565 [Planctomycetota bacterium]
MVRTFVLCWGVILAVETSPWGWDRWDAIKRPLSDALNACGLWQGQWSMFAPGPSVNNWWLTAEIETELGRESWASPFWMEVSAAEKFRRFRHLNYYNRIQLPQYQIAAFDFADFLRRNRMIDAYEAEPRQIAARHVRLYTNGLEMVPPAPGPLPSRDEIVWVSFSRLIAEAP